MWHKFVDYLSALLRVPLYLRTIAQQSERLGPLAGVPHVDPKEINQRLFELKPPSPESAWGLARGLQSGAMQRSVAIVESEMREALIFTDHQRFLKHALAKAKAPGGFCEFGVYRGSTINFMATARPGVTFDGFDSFEGLPEEWHGHIDTNFGLDGALPEVRPNVQLHKGWFDATLPDYRRQTERIALMHIDCDIYQSTRTIFDILGDVIDNDTVLIFDEYFNYPGFEMHERKAFSEYLTRFGRTANWFAICGQRAACTTTLEHRSS